MPSTESTQRPLTDEEILLRLSQTQDGREIKPKKIQPPRKKGPGRPKMPFPRTTMTLGIAESDKTDWKILKRTMYNNRPDHEIFKHALNLLYDYAQCVRVHGLPPLGKGLLLNLTYSTKAILEVVE
jgi:hypothetical protein